MPQTSPGANGHSSVRFRPHAVSATFEHSQPAFLGERYPIDVVLSNLDDHELEFDVDVLMQPAEDESGEFFDALFRLFTVVIHLVSFLVNEMTMEDVTSTSLIKGISFGTLKPGETSRRTLFLLSSGSAGERVLDFSIQSQSSSSITLPEGAQNIDETLHTLVVNAVMPLALVAEQTYSREANPSPGLLDLRRFDPTFFHRSYSSVTSAEVESCGPWEIAIESIKLLPKVWQILNCGVLI